MWNQGGRLHIFVTQPYPRPVDEIVRLYEFCETWGLSAEIGTWPAWQHRRMARWFFLRMDLEPGGPHAALLKSVENWMLRGWSDATVIDAQNARIWMLF